MRSSRRVIACSGLAVSATSARAVIASEATPALQLDRDYDPSLPGLRGDADDKLRRDLIAEFEFDPRKKARTYSKGNRQKVALVAAFAVLVTVFTLMRDEPTPVVSAKLPPVEMAAGRASTSAPSALRNVFWVS